MYSCSITSDTVHVNFISEVDLFPLFSSQGYMRYIPEFSCHSTLCNVPYRVVYRNRATWRLQYGKQVVVVEFPWSLMREGETIAYLAYPLLEYQRQQQGCITVHAASFSHKRKGVVLFGLQGAGKTSILIEAGRRFGIRVVGNDLCLISDGASLTTHGGTKFFHVRRESIRRNHPWMLPIFGPLQSDSWIDKRFFSLAELGIQPEKEVTEIKRIYFVHIDEQQKGVFRQRMNDLPTRVYINENFSRYIRTTCTAMFCGSTYEILGYIPSLDTKMLFERRRKLIHRVFHEIGIQYISGTVECVVNEIISDL